MHLYLCFGVWLIIFLWKICKAKQVKGTRRKKRRQGSGFGLPEGIALLSGNKSCYWLDKLCMGFRQCGAKDLNCARVRHYNWYENYNSLYLSIIWNCHPGPFMCWLVRACSVYLEFMKKDRVMSTLCRGQKKTNIVAHMFDYNVYTPPENIYQNNDNLCDPRSILACFKDFQ